MQWAYLCECPGKRGKRDSTTSFAKLQVWKLLERHVSMSPQRSPASPWVPPWSAAPQAVLVLGWMLVVLLAPVDSPSMVQAHVSSVSPWSPFMLDIGPHGRGLVSGAHSWQCKSRHSLLREGVCPALKLIQCTESAALLRSSLNPEKGREQGLS